MSRIPVGTASWTDRSLIARGGASKGRHAAAGARRDGLPREL